MKRALSVNGRYLAERLWASFTRQADGCWRWTGTMNGNGYGRTSDRGRLIYAHRAMYELLVGPIPAGLTLDHRCRNRACVNPVHLEAVSLGENVMRGETIARAHHEGRDCGSDGCKNCQRWRAA